ncbi:MAG: AAA family ATPase [Gemmatimonadota bacterium]|nr:AAA family ATPase [Gemmatimonadota bacterium]
MIHTVRIKGFKRFKDGTFRLPGHVVLAGPNNMGKTTVLQAIASWALALRRWRESNDFNPRRGYARVPIARQAFAAVPLRSFDLLSSDRRYPSTIEIELGHNEGWSVAMELIGDSTEQIYVRPKTGTDPDTLRELELPVVFVPPMTGLGIEEPVFQPPKIEQLLGLGRPGEVLRNLVAEANRDEAAWSALRKSMYKLFGYALMPPDTTGAHIIAEYGRVRDRRPVPPYFDVASAGSGFQQVLMLLAFLHTRPGTVLLLDEPDAHLHIILQDAVYHELRTVAARQRSQLVAATHSEVIINSVEPRELCVVLDEPRMVADTAERNTLVSSLRVLSNDDVMRALQVRGVLYVDDYTDIHILRALAARLDHRAGQLLTTEIMWKSAVFQTTDGAAGSRGIRAREHFKALHLVQGDLPGLELQDGDARPPLPETPVAGAGLQRLRWRRYEIESYLLHPDALARFVESAVGAGAAATHVEDMLAYWHDAFPPAVVKSPLGDHEYLNNTKARTKLLEPLLDAAGLHGLPYTRYHEIAETMQPEEIHPEVAEKLDQICLAFGVEP